MAIKSLFLIVCLASISTIESRKSSKFDACAGNSTNACNPGSEECMEQVERKLRRWYQTPAARNYNVIPIDPLVSQSITITNGTTSFVLEDVLITGLSKSIYLSLKVEQLSPTKWFTEDEYKHYLLLHAAKSKIMDPKTGKWIVDDVPILVTFEKVKMWSTGEKDLVKRCANTFIHMKEREYHTAGGEVDIYEGLKVVGSIIGTENVGMMLVESISEYCCRQIHEAKRNAYATIPYETFYEPFQCTGEP